MHIVCSLIWVSVGATPASAPVGVDGAESPLVYELAWSAAAPILPAELREFLSEHEAGFRANLLPVSANAPRNRPGAGAGLHNVALDAAARDGLAAERARAAADFPRKRAEARRLYEAYEVHEGGWLPWEIEEALADLIRAFKDGSTASAAEHCGLLMHLAVDAALPFNAVAQPRAATDGAVLPKNGDATSSSDEMESGRAAMTDRKERFHRVLISRLLDRLTYEVRVAPSRLRPAVDPLEAAFDVLLPSHSAAMELQRLEGDLILGMRLTDVEAAISAADEFLSSAAEMSAAILEERIEAGALLGANLIAGAWIQAGRPDLKSVSAAQSANGVSIHSVPPSADSISPAAALSAGAPSSDTARGQGMARPLEDEGLVGSLGSTVYHRQGCAHCARIKPENTVAFGSSQQAEAAGRRPCSQCKPNEKRRGGASGPEGK